MARRTHYDGGVNDSSYSSGPEEGRFHRAYPPYERIQPAPPDARPRFLILRLSAIGDVVMTTPVARELKRRYPGCLVVAGVEEKSEAIVRMNPYVDEVFRVNIRALQKQGTSLRSLPDTLRGLNDLTEHLKGYRFDTAIEMHARFRSALLAHLSGAPRRIGYDVHREGSGLFYTSRVPPQPITRPGEEFTNLLRPLGIDDPDPSLILRPPEEAVRSARRFFEEQGWDPLRCVALCPATSAAVKYWTEEGWADVANALSRDRGLIPLFLGGPGDEDLIRRIQSRMDSPTPSPAGKVTLEESAALVQQAALTIAVDTGLAFISIATGTPAVILHGPTAFDRMAAEPNVEIVAAPGACGRTRRRPCPGCACMSGITPQAVLDAARRLLET